MLSIFSCVCQPSVCLPWRNVCLALWPISWLGHLFFWDWAAGVACIFLRLILCLLLRLLLPMLLVMSKKSFPSPMSWKLSPLLSSKSFISLALMIRSLIHFEFNFYLWCKIRVQLHLFVCRYLAFPTPILEKILLQQMNSLVIFVKSHLTVYGRVFFLGSLSYSISLYACLYASTTLFLIYFYYF